MSWLFCLSGAAVSKAGANASTTATANATIMNKWSDDVEAQICALSRFDWIGNYSTYSGSNFINILSDTESDGVAMRIINYDMSGYTSRAEAQTMLNVLRDNFQRNIDFLKEKENQDFNNLGD